MGRLVVVLLWLFASVSHAKIGDRLIITINDTPYTQRQIEMYMTIKESLRKSDRVRLIRPVEWSVAVDVFTQDMIIFQESLRLGSFQPADQVVDRFAGAVEQKIASDDHFRENLKRLGVGSRDVRGALETVLRIDSFRKSKDRQDELAGEIRDKSARGKKSWFIDLEERAVIRLFREGKIYKSISPTL